MTAKLAMLFSLANVVFEVDQMIRLVGVNPFKNHVNKVSIILFSDGKLNKPAHITDCNWGFSECLRRGSFDLIAMFLSYFKKIRRETLISPKSFSVIYSTSTIFY